MEQAIVFFGWILAAAFVVSLAVWLFGWAIRELLDLLEELINGD